MLRHFLDDFMSFVPLQMPQLLNVATMEEPQFYGDYVLLTFPLRDSYDLEEVMDIFEDDMELITLYHHVPVGLEKSGHSTCAYSNPAFGQMFKMNARTDADGKVNRIIATIRFAGADVRRPVSRPETPRRERQLQVQKESGGRAVGLHVKQALCETRYTAKWFSASTRTARG